MGYKWGECSGCMSDGLLKRVAIYPGVLEVHHVYMCLDCRVNWRDDQYASLVESFKFNRVARAEWREHAEMKKAVEACR